jgi:hypothetical protein
MLFKEIIAVYIEGHRKPINTKMLYLWVSYNSSNEELLTVEAAGTYNYHWALKG